MSRASHGDGGIRRGEVGRFRNQTQASRTKKNDEGNIRSKLAGSLAAVNRAY